MCPFENRTNVANHILFDSKNHPPHSKDFLSFDDEHRALKKSFIGPLMMKNMLYFYQSVGQVIVRTNKNQSIWTAIAPITNGEVKILMDQDIVLLVD